MFGRNAESAFEPFAMRNQSVLTMDDINTFVDVMMTERETLFQILNDRTDHCLIIRALVDGFGWGVFFLTSIVILFSFTVLITIWGTVVGLAFVFGEFFFLISLSKLNMSNLFI